MNVNKKHTNRALVLLDQALVSGGNFALGVLLARLLGLSAFGTFSLLWMGALFALSLHQAFVSQPLMTLFAKKTNGERAAYFRSVFQLQLILSLGLAMLAGLVAGLLQTFAPAVGWLAFLPVMGGITALFLLQDTLRKLFFVKQKYCPPLLLDGLLYGLLLGSLLLLQAAGKLDLDSALFAMLLAYGASSLAGVFLFTAVNALPTAGSGLIGVSSKRQLQKTIKEHYHFSIWLLGTSLLQWFSGNFFLVATAGVLGTVAVGALRMAQNMVGLSHVLFLAMENIVPAEAAQQFFQHGRVKMSAYLRRISLLGSVPFGLLLAGLSVLSPWLIELLYGAEYLPYSYLVWVYSLHYVLVYLGYPLRFALRTLQFTSPIFVAYCLSAAASLLVAFPVVGAWGLPGAVAGLMGTQLLTLLVYVFYLGKKRGAAFVPPNSVRRALNIRRTEFGGTKGASAE